jgi:hypothetical protein
VHTASIHALRPRGTQHGVKLTLKEPGTYPAVNHAFGHAQNGAMALLEAA